MRLKRFVWLLPLLILLFVLPAHAALPEPTILLNGRPMALPADQRPLIVQGRTLVPMRALFEALGATITWDQATQTVTAIKGETVVDLTVDAPEAVVGDRSVPIDPPAQLIGGRTYVPLRAVVDLLGARIGWDGETATIRITDRRPAVGGELTLATSASSSYLPDFTADTANLAVRAIYGDGLLRYAADDMSYEPALAAAMPEVSGDGRTVTFRLRKGITFHDGHEVTAEDFLFSFALVAAHRIPGNFVLERMSAPDDYTVIIRTKTPHVAGALLMATSPPLPYHLLKGVTVETLKEHSFWKAPVGAGPYRFASQSQALLTLRRYPEFWEAKINPEIGPWLETLAFAFEPYGGHADLSYVNGRVDSYSGVPGEALQKIMGLRDSTLYQWQRFGYGALTFNTQAWPTSIKEVRQALSLALDREALVDMALGGAGVVPAGPFSDDHWAGGLPDPYRYDPQAAIALMEQAGFTRNAEGLFEKDGKVATVLVALTTSQLTEAIAEVTLESWKAIGIDVNIHMMDFNYMVEEYLKPGKFHAYFMGFSPPVDPAFYYPMWSQAEIILTTNGINAGLNRGRYTNPQLETLLPKMKAAPTQERRDELAEQALAILQEDAPAIWLYSNLYGELLPSEVRGVIIRPAGGPGRPEYWYIDTK
ncbi:MAG TPA: ABC transporter substrate-binding protein [Symbiobacteriaceae bacterium]|nr:ABC transporter substrate-binding protein [Symbiobacteriaceae bacterium]